MRYYEPLSHKTIDIIICLVTTIICGIKILRQ